MEKIDIERIDIIAEKEFDSLVEGSLKKGDMTYRNELVVFKTIFRHYVLLWDLGFLNKKIYLIDYLANIISIANDPIVMKPIISNYIEHIEEVVKNENFR